jgi:uncharacterized damage-inducible protein DinB
MNYYGPKELATSFRTVRKNTIQVAEDIPEEKYGFRAAADSRTVAQTLAHIAMIPRVNREIGTAASMEGIDFPKIFAEMSAEEAKPRTKAELVKWLRASGEDFAKWLETLREDVLAQVVTLPAGSPTPSRTRFDMILGVKEHEMHHRAQLMLMERMLGITPHLTRQNQERMAAMQQGQKAQSA